MLMGAQQGGRCTVAAEGQPKARSLAPVEIVKRWPLWLQVIVVLTGMGAGPAGVSALTVRSDSDKLDSIAASIAELQRERKEDRERLAAIAERVARIEGSVGPLAIAVRRHESLQTRVVAATAHARQGDTDGVLAELQADADASDP
jgi:hypothetical protein